MHARTTRSRKLRSALSGASALVIVALIFGLPPAGIDAFQKAALAKGDGPGAGGPPDHSSAGGQGGGHGNGHGGGLSGASHGEDEDHIGKYKLGKLNAANAAAPALLNANPDSTVGQTAIYQQMVKDGTIEDFEDAKEFLDMFANKEVTVEVVEALNELLGVAFP